MNDLIQSSFDYAALPVDAALNARAAAERIKLRLKRTVEDIIEIGRELTAVKEELPHGQFLPWIAAEFEMSKETAQNFLSVYERFGGKNVIITNLKPTILYALSAPSTPDSVIEKAIEKAESGEKVTVADVKDWKAELEAERKAREQAEQRVEDAVAEWKQRSKDWHSQYIGERDKRKQVEFELSAASRRQAEIQTPADYDALKQTERDLRNELADLKQQQRELVQQQVVAKLAERQREINDLEKKASAAQQNLDALQRQIGAYSSQERELEVHLEENERARVALARLAANMAGWNGMVRQDAELLKWRALADMMEQGAAAIRHFIGDAKPSLIVIAGGAA